MRTYLAGNHILLATFILALLVAAGGCGGKSTKALLGVSSSQSQQDTTGAAPEKANPAWEPGKEIALAQAIADIKGYALPAEIDASLQDQLKAELIRVLSARGDSKLISTPPDGEPNRIMDLRLSSEAGGDLTLAWSYISLGDYDQNGEVNISDLTPLGVNFGLTGTFAYSTALSVIDGDDNGEMNIADVTPIGQHLRNSVVRYMVYASADMADYPVAADAPNGEGATLLGTVAFTSAAGVPAVDRLSFTYTVAVPVAGDYYWVRPSDGTSEGAPSSMISAVGRGDWWMFGREPQQNARSLYSGPWGADLLWTYAAGDEVRSSPAIRADGTVYVGCDDNNLHAINPDGTPAWTFLTEGDVSSSPAISRDGTVYVGSGDYNLYAINPDGTLRWQVTAEDAIYGSPSIGADGTVYVGSYDSNLYAISPGGEVDWTFPTGDAISACPAIGPDGTIVVGSYDGMVYAVNPDGIERWRFPTGDFVRSSAAIAPDGTVYVCSADDNFYAISAIGTELWRYSLGFIAAGSPAIGADGTVYLSADDHLHAFNPDGTHRWLLEQMGYKGTAPAIGADGSIFVGVGDSFYAIHSYGAQHWFYETGDSLLSSAAIRSDGAVIVGSSDGNVYAFRGGTGTAAAVNDVLPRDGIEGTQVTFNAILGGTPPFAFEWDFGGGAIPGTSTEQSPTITLGAVGTYEASVTVENAHGVPATFPFEMMVTPSSYSEGWVRSWGGEQRDYVHDIAVDSLGNVYTVGSTDSYGAGHGDVLLLKYDAAGTLQFAETWGGARDDWAMSVVIDGSDNIYVAGGTEGFEGVGNSLVLLRYSPDGTLSWQKVWDSGEEEMVRAMALDSSGNVYLAGDYVDDDDWRYKGLLVRYTAVGNFDWARSWGGDQNDYFTSMAIDGADTVYVGGRCRSFGEGESDMLLVRYSSAGDLEWARTYGSEESELRCAVALDDDDNVYIAGGSAYVVRYTPAGVLDWARTWHELGTFQPRDIRIIGGNIYLVGQVPGSFDNWNPALMQGSLTGDVSWGQLFATVYDDDLAYSIAPASAGQLCLAGLGWSNRGWWEDFPVATIADPAVENVAAGVVADIVGVASDVNGTAQFVTGTVDTGGGGEDALVISWDFSGVE